MSDSDRSNQDQDQARSGSRRQFLKTTAVGALALGSLGWIPLGCDGPGDEPSGPDGIELGHGGAAVPLPDGKMDATAQCQETDDNIEGPFYRADAPEKTTLVTLGMVGWRLDLSGRVLGETCQPLADAVLDVWQADAYGSYDLQGYELRGKFRTDQQGQFVIPTIIPARYLNGPTYRPRHIHFKVNAPGHTLLTTQLYFYGDPYNDSDPWYLPSLRMGLARSMDGTYQGSFDFVLAR
jgi:hypothetical protein